MTRLRLTVVLSFFTLVVGGQAMAWSGAEHVIKVTGGYKDRVKDNLWQERLQQQERQPAKREQVPRQGTPALADDWSDCAGSNADIAIGACTRLIQADGGYIDPSTLPRVLHRRDSSPEIEALQRFLAGLGYDVGTIDGVYGPATQQAILMATREQRVSVRDLMLRGLHQRNLAIAYAGRGVAYYNRGTAYADNGDYDRAIADLDQAIRLDPNDATTYANRGGAYGRKGEHDRAIADFDQAIRLKPDYLIAYGNRGHAYVQKGEYDAAIADFDQVTRLNPNDAKAYNHRGYAYDNKGDHDRAIAEYTEAIQLDPRDANVYYNRGKAYDANDEYAKALIDFRVAISLIPSDDPLKDEALPRIAEIEKRLATKPVVTTAPYSSPDKPGRFVAERAILYEEPIGADGAGVSAINAAVTWRLINDGANGPEVEAHLEVPERGMTVRFAVHKNLDGPLPASHLIEVTVNMQSNFPGQAITEVPRVVMKTGEEERGQPLVGAAAKVRDGFFWVALSADQNDIASNVALLRARNWIDLPFVYGTGQRAILTFEKGTSGERVFEEAFAAWETHKPGPAMAVVPSPAPSQSGSPNIFTGGTGGIVVEVSQRQINGQKTAFVGLSGAIKEGDEKYFNQALQTVDAPMVIVSLQGPGGAFDTGITIGKIIWNNQYSTLVGNDFCVSMCAYAWLAGRHRYASPDAQIGFHAPWQGNETNAEVSSVGSTILGGYLWSLGITTDAMAYMTYPGPNDEMQFLTAKDARELGIYFEEWQE